MLNLPTGTAGYPRGVTARTDRSRFRGRRMLDGIRWTEGSTEWNLSNLSDIQHRTYRRCGRASKRARTDIVLTATSGKDHRDIPVSPLPQPRPPGTPPRMLSHACTQERQLMTLPHPGIEALGHLGWGSGTLPPRPNLQESRQNHGELQL